MNTVDALNVLGKALCGDSFEVKPGLTDAETILEIAKNYTGGSGGSGGGTCNFRVIDLTEVEEAEPVEDELFDPISACYQYEKDLVQKDFLPSCIVDENSTHYIDDTDLDEGYIKLVGEVGSAGPMASSIWYNPATGHILFYSGEN